MIKKFSKQILAFWKQTYRESKLLFYTEAVGTVTSIIASFVIATTSPTPNLWLVFSFYLVGSLTLQYASWVRGSAWLFVLMSWYTLMNLIGMYNLL